nr:MAG TPA: hypothetical protein [Caudoviricetes sp.]
MAQRISRQAYPRQQAVKDLRVHTYRLQRWQTEATP